MRIRQKTSRSIEGNHKENSGLTALIPLKARAHCKSRLASELDTHQRIALVHKMLGDIVSILASIPEINRIVIVSPENDGLPENVDYIRDNGDSLNNSLQYATTMLFKEGCQQLLILPADLAYLQRADVEKLIDEADNYDIVLAPSCDGGTNALLFSCEKPMAFQFGPDSCSAHKQFASNQGYSYGLVESYGLSTDIDTANDLNISGLNSSNRDINKPGANNLNKGLSESPTENNIEVHLPGRARA